MSKIKKVQIRNGFSDRNNIDKLNETLQIDSFDERTRIQMYNYFSYIFNDRGYMVDYENLYIDILLDVYCEIIDNYDAYSISIYIRKCKEYIKSTFLHDRYDAVLSLIEYLVNRIDSDRSRVAPKIVYDSNGNGKCVHLQEVINELFEKECVGYRFVGKKIVAITDRIEIEEIEESLQSEYEGCRAHLEKAVGFLADREQKDYKNSIKESISAVESICCIIADKRKATLGDALNILERKCGLKGQLKSAFEKLYAYTNNDKGGIRHAEGVLVSEVSFEEAKFMLVSCSAFVNYLIAEYGKAAKD